MKLSKNEKCLEKQNVFLKNKKAQLTLFIVIGIAMALAVIIVITVQKESGEKGMEPSVRIAEKVPVEFNPIGPFVEGCINKIATEALIKLGEHGGYTNPSEYGIKAGADPTSGSGVAFSPGSELVIPYWFHLSSGNDCTENCQFKYGRPALTRGEDQAKSIEAQLDKYVDANLKGCLNEFRAFKDQFIIKEEGKIKTTATVAQNDVVFLVEYPLEAAKGETKAKISSFYAAVPLNLKKIYEIATLITNLQGEYKYLEKDTLDFIAGFSAVDGKKLPPMSATEFKFGSTTIWSKTNVRESLQDALAAYIQLLQVYGARNYEERVFPGNELKEALYSEGMLVPGNDAFSDVDIFFNYLSWWPIYLDLNCDGEACRPESVSSSFLALLGIQRYNFIYDVSFPVLVSIHDPYALKNKGYDFRFFLEGNIRNNKAMEFDFSPLEAPSLAETSMLCDMDKWSSGNITIDVRDDYGNPLDEVQLAYTCAGESCFIGEAKEGALKSRFPVCLGGIVSYMKEGYLGYSENFDAELEKDNKLSAALIPFKFKKYDVKKYKIIKGQDGWALAGSAVDLDFNEEALITLSRKGSINEEEFQTMAHYKDGKFTPEELKIVPGDYSIDIQLILNERIAIPEKERCEKVLFKKKCFTIPEVEFEKFPNGGLKLNYTFAGIDLEKDKITFYAASPDIKGIPAADREIEDIEQMSKVDEYSSAYEAQLKPAFS